MPFRYNYQLVDDLPLENAREFNFDRIVMMLFEFITNPRNRTPLSLCIDGKWGTGKTSLMRTLKNKIEVEAPTYRTLFFAPWKLSTEEAVITALVNLVLREIQEDASFIGQSRIELKGENVLRVLSQRLLQVNIDELSASYQWSSRVRGSFTEVENLFRRVTAAYLKSGKRDSDAAVETSRHFVVFIDDLDRCPPQRVVAVLEAVKLFFDMPGFVFVFGMDRSRIEDTIQERYESFDKATARTYLDKMFQLTYQLPVKEEKSLMVFVAETMTEMAIDIQSSRLQRALIGAFGFNLRQLKLFLNSFNFQRHLLAEEDHTVSDEVLFKWLYMQAAFPSVFYTAVTHKHLGLFIALEFLARNALLHDNLERNRYIGFLSRQRMSYVELITLAVVKNETRLDWEQKSIVDTIHSDGNVFQALPVLREGDVSLLDQNLPRIAYLTRGEISAASINVFPEYFDKSSEGGEKKLISLPNSILDRNAWKKIGDGFYESGDHRSSYYPYLMALLVDIHSGTSWADLATVYRKLGHSAVARALFRQAVEVEPTNSFAYVMLAYLYDFDEDDNRTASLIYRKVLMMGYSQAVVDYNLALNMKRLGDVNRACFYALRAYFKESDNEDRYKRVKEYAALVGRVWSVSFGEFNEELTNELEKAAEILDYPLTSEEEREIELLLSTFPHLSDVKDLLRSPPL